MIVIPTERRAARVPTDFAKMYRNGLKREAQIKAVGFVLVGVFIGLSLGGAL